MYWVSNATELSSFGRCLTFYGVSAKAQYSLVRLELESNQVLMKAYRAGDPQAKLEVGLIHQLSKSELYSESKWLHLLDERTQKMREANPGKTYLTPVLVYHKQKQDYVAIRAGEIPPKGYTLFSGTFSNPVYYGMIAKGLYPIGDLISQVKFFGMYIPERTLQHGLAHMGGFWENPEYSRFLLELADFYINHKEQATNTVLYKKIGFFSESVWFPEPAQRIRLERLLKVISGSLGLSGLNKTVAAYSTSLMKLDFAALKKAAKYLIELTPDISPVAGGARDYAEKSAFAEKMKTTTDERGYRNARQGYDTLTGLSLKESLDWIDLKENFDRFSQEELAQKLSAQILKMEILATTELQDWFDLSIEKETVATRKLRDFFCTSMVFSAEHSLSHIFCN